MELVSGCSCDGCLTASSSSSCAAVEKFAQILTEQFASDYVHVEVVGVNETVKNGGEIIDITHDIGERGDDVPVDDVDGGQRAAEQNVDERSADQQDGGHGRVGRG